MFRRDHRRPFYADERNEFRRMRPHAPPFHPQQRFESYDAPYLEEIPAGPIRPRRRMPMPQYYEEESSSHLDNYRSYQSSEPDSGPKPLLPPETIEKLRANLHMVNQRLNRYQNQDEDQYDDRYENRFGDRYDDRYQDRNEVRYQDQYDDRYEDRYDVRYEDQYEEVCDREADPYEPRQGPSSIGMGALDPNEYVQEEEVTKKTIEEIIMVAQALREKLERREAAAQLPETRRLIDFHDEGFESFQQQRPRQPILETPVAVPDPPTSTEVVSKTPAKIPSLLEIKPKIPSLLEIHVEPPPEVEYFQPQVEYFQPQVEYFHENVEPYNRYIPQRRGTRDLCWNCNKTGHRHENCWFPLKEFCFRCGKQGFNDETCPNCP